MTLTVSGLSIREADGDAEDLLDVSSESSRVPSRWRLAGTTSVLCFITAARSDDLFFVCQVRRVKSVCQLRPSDLKRCEKAKDVERDFRMALRTTLILFYDFFSSHCTQHRVNKLDDRLWVPFFCPVTAFSGRVPALSPLETVQRSSDRSACSVTPQVLLRR